MTDAKRIRVLLADDDRLAREGTASYLREEKDMIIETTGDLDMVVPLARSFEADVVVLDILFFPRSDRDGIDILKRLSRDVPAARVLMLTGDIEPHQIRAAYKLGAKGYINKGEVELLVDGIRTVSSGRYYYGSYIDQILPQGQIESPTDALSNRERDVLFLLRRDATLSNLDIADILGIGERTVEKHLGNIYAKLPNITGSNENAKRRNLCEYARKERIDGTDECKIEAQLSKWRRVQ